VNADRSNVRSRCLLVPGLVAAGILGTAFLVLAATERPGVDWHALFREGNEAYAAKDFDTAVAKYSQIADSGVMSGAVEFNLGNAYFRSGDLGRAILHYERARRLLPRNRDVRQNLRIARKQTEDLAIETDENPVVRFSRGICFSLTGNEWGVLVSLSFFTLGGLLTARTFVRGEGARLRLRHAAVVVGLLFLLSAGSAAAHWYRYRQPEGVIVVPEVKLYAEPDPGPADKHLFMLHEGSTVSVLRSEGDWILVRYEPGMRGFLPADSLARI